MPLVSVIIPVYNGEKTIVETIFSVLNQSFQDFELIIINDGSTDQTLEIIAQFQDDRIQPFTYPNAGLATSRNRGIARAQGQYISFIDADDLWTSDKLEAQFQALESTPKAAVAYSWTDLIDQSSQFLNTDSRASFSGNVYPHILLGSFPSNGSNVMVRRQALLELGGFDESLNAAEDWEMWIRLAANYFFVAVSKPQILYRISPGSMSTKLTQHETESLKVIERAFIQAPEELHYLKPQSLANLYKYLTFKALDGKQGIKALQFFWQAVKYDPKLLQGGITGKVIFKATILTLCPPPLAESFLQSMGKLTNTNTLLGYINLEVP
ncbi:MAG: glycosyltransferase [Oscillatoriales cyanobacterium RM2_1_1]|nr:glycosyltransferase [Oscillatoriales cyanobacterium SM2_3_0]NJO46027.1 glycosyltransferase [Oscillatoriales cyanobacterium RM2_1_1]